MAETSPLTLETFSERVGEPFRIHADDDLVIDASLAEATALGDGPHPTHRVPFSLVFRAPVDRILPQRIYRLENVHLGTLEMFLVPLQPDADGARYEAVFT